MPKKKTKDSTVKIIRETGETSLVEILQDDGYPIRGYVPTASINLETNTIPPDVLEAMTPFGLPWEELVRQLSAPDLEDTIGGELRKIGVFTLDDLNRHSGDVHRIFQAALGLYLGRFHELAHIYQKEA